MIRFTRFLCSINFVRTKENIVQLATDRWIWKKPLEHGSGKRTLCQASIQIRIGTIEMPLYKHKLARLRGLDALAVSVRVVEGRAVTEYSGQPHRQSLVGRSKNGNRKQRVCLFSTEKFITALMSGSERLSASISLPPSSLATHCSHTCAMGSVPRDTMIALSQQEQGAVSSLRECTK